MAGRADTLLRRLESILGRDGLRTDPASLLVYSRDASHMALGRPGAVALPADPDQAAAVVRACAEAGVPLVCRGTGTGLSGGALPEDGWVVLSTGRLGELGPWEESEARIHARPGVLNAAVSDRLARQGWHFAPDPSSQSAASIGGNIAENAGGPHCLRHGVTLQHLLQLEWCDAGGNVWQTGPGLGRERGLDLTSLLCGSEGTLGVITGAWLNLLPSPACEATLLAFFPRLDQATRAVVQLLSRGLQPVAVEMVDRAMLQAVEETFAFGFSTEAAAAMICEFAGADQAVAEDADLARTVLQEAGATGVRLAKDETERTELWKCRKKAFGAVGRLTPSYVTMDVVVPLGQLPALVERIQEIKARHRVEISTAFHAGDGNLHPGVHYDDRDEDSHRRAHAAADEIIRTALALGGSCTGEHGVGVEKLHALTWQLDGVNAHLQREIKELFDPREVLNPRKAVPLVDARQVESFPSRPEPPEEPRFAWESLTVTAPAPTPLADLQARALERGLWIPTGLVCGPTGLGAEATVGGLFDNLWTGPALLAGASARDAVLEIWARTGAGEGFHAGAPVFKNVAGYDLTHTLCGAAGAYATVEAVTLGMKPAPEAAALHVLRRRQAQPPEPDRPLTGLRLALDRHLEATAGYNLILDPGSGVLAVLAAGRDRPWDLGRLPEILAAALPDHEVVEEQQVPFARGPELLDDSNLPPWSREAGDWWAAGFLPGAQSHIPPAECRLIYQSARRIWWSPESIAWPELWWSEAVVRAGRPVLPPLPAGTAPPHLLEGLKRIFDPDGKLGPAHAPMEGGSHD